MIDLKMIYERRRIRVCDFMKKTGLKAAVFEDSEERRDPAVRYLTGHPSDAYLILVDDGRNWLVAWDENLAKDKAHVQELVPSTRFNRDTCRGIKEILSSVDHDSCSAAEFSPMIPMKTYQNYFDALHESWEVVCNPEEDSVHDFVVDMRAVKDEYEIECTRNACAITDQMTCAIIEGLKNGTIKTEMDVALFAERELRLKGAERTSFDTLAAGPDRSFAIHAFPGYTAGVWGSRGLSILDYGVCVEGYASDCTITVARGPLDRKQEELLDLVQMAADECRKLYAPGKKISDAVNKADEIFAAASRKMPHGLGHGTGLEIHEAPFVSSRTEESKLFVPGNIITLEPGLYDRELGGVRLENDVLITNDGNEILTHSQIFRM